MPAPIPAGFVSDCEVADRYGWGFPPDYPFASITRTPASFSPAEPDELARVERRGTEVSRGRGDDSILVIGDSVTFGVCPMEDNLSVALESLLLSEGYRVEVMSIAMSGSATTEEFEAYKKEGVLYSPDIVISQFCGNDLVEF